MTLKEALGLVEEVRNCSLPWDNAHWEALGMVIEFVKNALNEKSLRPQSHWRPSDEQMLALHKVSEWSTISLSITEPLISLYNDLKKLKD